MHSLKLFSFFLLFLFNQIAYCQHTKFEDFFQRGLDELNNMKYKEALFFFDQAIQLDSTNINALNYRGVAKYELNNYVGAYNDYSKALQYSITTTKRYLIYCNRSQTLNALSKYNEAIADCNMALQEMPDDKISLLNRGIAYDKLKKYELAITDFSKIIALDSMMAKSYGALGLTLYHQSKFNEALTSLDKATSIDTSYAIAFHWKGLVYANLNRPSEAIHCFTKSLACDPNQVEPRVMKGLMYYEIRKKELACFELNNALSFTNEESKIKVINSYLQQLCK